MSTLTYREAARRVRRSVRTINRWRKAGMHMTWENQHGQRVRVVEEDVLLAHWRGRLDANPPTSGAYAARWPTTEANLPPSRRATAGASRGLKRPRHRRSFPDVLRTELLANGNQELPATLPHCNVTCVSPVLDERESRAHPVLTSSVDCFRTQDGYRIQ